MVVAAVGLIELIATRVDARERKGLEGPCPNLPSVMPRPVLPEVLPFRCNRPVTVTPAKEVGPSNHPYTKVVLIAQLGIDNPADLQKLLKTLEAIFGTPVDLGPLTNDDFHWIHIHNGPDGLTQRKSVSLVLLTMLMPQLGRYRYRRRTHGHHGNKSMSSP